MNDLDAEIAVKIMGWIRTPDPHSGDGQGWFWMTPDGRVVQGSDTPEFSTNISDAWLVVEKLADHPHQSVHRRFRDCLPESDLLVRREFEPACSGSLGRTRKRPDTYREVRGGSSPGGLRVRVADPDDTVVSASGEYAQARPNVVFELGWFYGRLGRRNVCFLFKTGTKIHSDLDGVSRIEFQNTVMEKLDEIERELLAAGLLQLP